MERSYTPEELREINKWVNIGAAVIGAVYILNVAEQGETIDQEKVKGKLEMALTAYEELPEKIKIELGVNPSLIRVAYGLQLRKAEE